MPAIFRFLQANGLEFGLLERGPADGPLVLCLHGFPDGPQSFLPLLDALDAAGYRAVAPAMRGYLPSGIPADGDYRPVTLARDVIALIDHLGAEKAVVVGHDWGAVATYLAAAINACVEGNVIAADNYYGRYRQVVATVCPR